MQFIFPFSNQPTKDICFVGEENKLDVLRRIYLKKLLRLLTRLSFHVHAPNSNHRLYLYIKSERAMLCFASETNERKIKFFLQSPQQQENGT